MTAAILAGRDFLSEWRMSLCLVLGLAAVLAPLLVLFGLRYGIVETLTERLRADPRNRELVLVGHGRFGPDWFAAMTARPEVGFVLPRTRALAATLDVTAADRRLAPGATLEMIPTAPGDPLVPTDLPPLAAAPADRPQPVLLSAAAARELDAAAGARLTGRLTRTVDGRRQQVSRDLTVAGILPDAAFARPAVFLPLDLLAAAERWREGFGVPALGWAGADATGRADLFAGFRLYARDLVDVAPLATWLGHQGLEVRTRSAEIDRVLALDASLRAVFLIVAGVGVTGYVISLGASLWANVARKRRALAVLRLLGADTATLVAFPVVQAGLVAVLGTLVAMGLYGIAAAVLNRHFGASLSLGESICRLAPGHFAMALGLSLAAAVLAAAVAALGAARVDPATGLREG